MKLKQQVKFYLKSIFNDLNDGQISEQRFKFIVEELDKYIYLKEKTHSKQSGLSETEK